MKDIKNFFAQKRFSKIPSLDPGQEFQNFYNAVKYTVELNQGDMLYIPAGWSHFVFSTDIDPSTQLNLAISFFHKFPRCPDCDISYSSSTPYPQLQYKQYNPAFTNKEYQNYKNTSHPFLLQNYFKEHPKWNCFSWNKDILNNIFSNESLLVNKSSSKMFTSNYIGLSEETLMSFNEFSNKPLTDPTNNYYLIQQGYNHSKKLLQDISVPSFIKSEEATNFAMWLNFGNVYSSLHYDLHDNILTQIQGNKKVVLFPPSERDKLYMYNPYHPKFLCKLASRLK